MRLLYLILPMILLACIVGAVTIPEDSADDDECSIITFVENTPDGDLYRIDLKNGPVYYLETERNGEKIIKITAFATMYLNIDAAISNR